MPESKLMLTKDSPQQRHHPWTRVSWISGSDIDDDLNEEEVQEVESITLGRAKPSTGPETTINTEVAPPTVISPRPNPEEEEEVKPVQPVMNSLTLNPFRFGTGDNSGGEESTGSILAPFAFNNVANSLMSDSAVDPNGVPKQDTPDTSALFPKNGDLITPAATENPGVPQEETAPTISKKPSSWKSFWSQGAEPQEEDNPNEVMDNQVTDLVVKGIIETEESEPELQEEEPPAADDIWAAALLSQRLQVSSKGMVAAGQEKAKGCFLWVVDGFLILWTRWVSLGILLNTWMKTGITTTKTFCQKSADSLVTYCQVRDPRMEPLHVYSAFGFWFVFFPVIIYLSTIERLPSPTDDLRDFVRFEKANNVVDLKQIDDLNTDAFRTYARSTCVVAATFSQARSALDIGLKGVPDNVRSDIVEMAVQKGVTQKNSVQDSNSEFANAGKANAFMAFWSTVYDSSSEQEAYKTCVMVTGVALTVAETIAEWTTKTEKYQVGSEPCHCGYVYCEECPIFDVREVTWPVFERRSLSLRKQEELRRWMVDQAVKSAEHLVLDGAEKLKLDGGSGAVVQSPQFSWTGQTSAAFFGEESHKDRVRAGQQEL